MAKVRGITVEIAADAKKFNSAMRELKADSKEAQKDLNALQKGLELEFDAKKFKEAQAVAQKALETSAAKADALRIRMAELEKSGNIDTAEYRKLQSELRSAETDTIKLNKQIEQLNKMPLDNLVKNIDKVSAGFNKAASATKGISMAAGGAIAGLGALGLKAVSTADDLATTSTKLGITAEQLQKFDYIALQTDTDAEQLSKAFVKVRATIVDLSKGIQNNASVALAQLGVDFSQFSSADEAFYGVIDALGKMDNEIDMVAAANELFGDEMANELIPIIKAGGDNVKELAAEFETLGGLSNAEVEKLAAFDNVINRITTQVKNLFLQIGTALLPIMEKLGQFVEEKIVPAIQKLADWFGKLSTGQIEFGLKALAAVAMLSPVLGMIGKLTGAVSGLAGLLGQGGGLTKALDFLKGHPIIAIIGVIAMIVMLLYTTNEQFRESLNRLIGVIGGALAPLLDIIMGALNDLMGLLSPIIDMVGGALSMALNIVLDALSPVFGMLDMLFSLLQPLITIALLPLQLALMQLSIPLQLLGSLLGWLMPIFDAFAGLVQGVFNFIMKIINKVLGWVEDAINWVIDKINSLIRGINNLGGWLGIHINEMAKVSLQIKTTTDEQYSGGKTPDTGGAPTTPDNPYADGGSWYDGMNMDNITGGDTYNTDNSTKNTTQNVTVTVQNYSAEVDIDKMVKDINRKLVEAM